MLGYDDELTLRKNEVEASWVNIGEGISGDYDENDPNDVNLLRFEISICRDGIWDAVEDASYCTQVPADTDDAKLTEILQFILKEYYNVLHDDPECSVKKLGETLSWISI